MVCNFGDIQQCVYCNYSCVIVDITNSSHSFMLGEIESEQSQLVNAT